MARPVKAKAATRIETDSFGPIAVPADRYWGAQTQRSIENFRIGGETMPQPLILALCLVKLAAARVNARLGVLPAKMTKTIERAAREALAADRAERRTGREATGWGKVLGLFTGGH